MSIFNGLKSLIQDLCYYLFNIADYQPTIKPIELKSK